MHELLDAGRVAHWGVSNFDVDDMQELAALPALQGRVAPQRACAANQVYFSLSQRGPEFSLLPWLHEHGVPLMAYSPIDQGTLARHATLATIGKPRGLSAAQVALAWVAMQPGVVAIPKAATAAHLRENLDAAEVTLDAGELQQIDRLFAPPRRKSPLAMT